MKESDRFCVSGQGSRNLHRMPKSGVSRIRGMFLAIYLRLIFLRDLGCYFSKEEKILHQVVERVAMYGLCKPLICSLYRLLCVYLSVNS